MKISEKLKMINAGVDMPTPARASRVVQTAPGSLMAFMARESDALKENAELKEKLEAVNAGELVRKLDPALIDESAWANRDASNFSADDPDFALLKTEIANAGGNVQPIKVRPSGQRYEVVFGHRRLRACKDLGLPVLAIVETLDDQRLFVEMDRENRARKNLSPYEQGVMYKRALDEGLFKTQSEMMSALGVSQGWISKAIAVASLPDVIVNAFPSKVGLAFRHAQAIRELLDANEAGVTKRAAELAATAAKLPTADVLKELTDAALAKTKKADLIEFKRGEGGHLRIKINQNLDEKTEKKLLAYIMQLLGET